MTTESAPPKELVWPALPYAEWKAQYQQEASAEQQAAFARASGGEPASHKK